MSQPSQPRTLLRPPAVLLALVSAALALSGCGLLHGSAQVGPDLKPHLGTSVSIPFGK